MRIPPGSSAQAPVLAICGAGNAAHTIAVVASENFDGDIVWLTSSQDSTETLRERVLSQEGLRSTGVLNARANKVRVISSDPAEVIPHADLIMIAVPSFAHTPILQQIRPYLKGSALVGVLPARSGFEFEVADTIPEIRPRGGRTIFGLQTLPWATRVQQLGRVVNIIALKAMVPLATLPHGDAPGVARQLSELIGTQILPTANFLALTLGNPGQIIHPGIMYGLFAGWSGNPYREDDIPRFYADVSDETGAFVARLSEDVIAVARSIEAKSRGRLDVSEVLPIHEWLRVSYPTQISDFTSVATCFRTHGPLGIRKPPMREIAPGRFVPDFNYRYLTEDVPFGLAIVKAIADIGQIETPSIDAVIGWAQEKMGKRYLVAGKLDGADVRELRVPQNYGIRTLPVLVDWYLDWS